MHVCLHTLYIKYYSETFKKRFLKRFNQNVSNGTNLKPIKILIQLCRQMTESRLIKGWCNNYVYPRGSELWGGGAKIFWQAERGGQAIFGIPFGGTILKFCSKRAWKNPQATFKYAKSLPDRAEILQITIAPTKKIIAPCYRTGDSSEPAQIYVYIHSFIHMHMYFLCVQ